MVFLGSADKIARTNLLSEAGVIAARFLLSAEEARFVSFFLLEDVIALSNLVSLPEFLKMTGRNVLDFKFCFKIPAEGIGIDDVI